MIMEVDSLSPACTRYCMTETKFHETYMVWFILKVSFSRFDAGGAWHVHD